MRNVVIRSLAAATAIGAVIFGNAGAAAANPAPTASPTTQAAGGCPLGTDGGDLHAFLSPGMARPWKQDRISGGSPLSGSKGS